MGKEGTPIRQNRPKAETAGILFGTIGRKASLTERIIVKGAEIEVSGRENLIALQGIPYLLVPNPVKPDDGGPLKSGLGIDYPFVDYVVRLYTGRRVRDVINFGWSPNTPMHRTIEDLSKGVLEGYKKVPFDGKAGHIGQEPDQDFFTSFAEAVQENNPILMFVNPRRYYEDNKVYSPGEVSPLISKLAREHHLPIVVVRITGANHWKRGLKVELSFDKPFTVEEMTDEQINQEIATRLENLRPK